MAEFSNFSSISKFDIIDFASKILKEIESIRSYELSSNYISEEYNKYPSESRVNTFFRLLGLPMFVSVKNKDKNNKKNQGEFTLMSPGFSKSRIKKNYNLIITDAEKTSNKDKLSSILINREIELKKLENSIGTEDFNKNILLSLANSPNYLAANLDGYIGPIGKQRIIYKHLFPLITSYKEIFPKSYEIASPFAIKSDRYIDNNTELRMPFIETVIRIRLITGGNSETTKEKENKQNDLINIINRQLAESDYKEILEKFSKIKTEDVFQYFVLNKLFLSIQQISNKWVEVLKRQQKISQEDIFNISIKTQSSRVSTLGKRLSISTDLSLTEGSALRQQLIVLRKKAAEEQLYLSLLPTQDIVDSAFYNQNLVPANTLGSALVNEFINILSSDLNNINKEILNIEQNEKKLLQQAEILRVELDMMTGEFSGLSIPDIVSVIIALFAIDLNDLLALIDKDSVEDMKKDKNLKPIIEKLNLDPNADSAYNAIKKLEIMVDNIFSLFNSYVKASINKEERRTSNNKNKKPISGDK